MRSAGPRSSPGASTRSHARADRVAALVAVGAEVQEAQRRATDGAHTDLRAVGRKRRALLDELTDAAAASTDNPTASRASVAATLDGASLDPELQPVLLAGRLSRELPPVARFELGDAPARPTRSVAAPRRAVKPARDDLAVRRTRQALEQARVRADDATAQAHDATEAVRHAERDVDDAIRGVTDLQAALDAARATLLGAKRRVTEARRAETSAKTAERRAAASVREAEQAAREA